MRERSFYKNSQEYRSYLQTLERNPALSLYSDRARELGSVDQLVEQGFLVVSDAYMAWVEAERVPLVDND